jgi:hypothetical protein
MWSPIYLKVYFDFGDCSFILMNVWKVGLICSTVTHTKFTVTQCINYKHHKNILILMEIPFLNRLDIHLLLLYCVVFCNYDISRVILDVWMCKQDRSYSAIPDQDPGFNGSSRCNVWFVFGWLFCVVYIFALYCIEECKSVTNIMFNFEDTVMLLVIQ